MKIAKIVLLLCFININSYSQRKCTLSSNEILTVIEQINFKPINELRGDLDILKKYLLTVDENSALWNQVCIESWYACEKKKENHYKIWKMDYGYLSEDYWNKNCTSLIFLLYLDSPNYNPDNRK